MTTIFDRQSLQTAVSDGATEPCEDGHRGDRWFERQLSSERTFCGHPYDRG